MSRRRRACPAVIAALIVTVAWLGGSASAHAANTPPLSCSPSSVTLGTSATCTAVGSPGESFTFATSGSGKFSAPSCTIAASTSSCSVTYTPAVSGAAAISYGANGFSTGASTIVTGIAAAPNDVFTCNGSTIVFGQPIACSATNSRAVDISFSSRMGTFTPASCTQSVSCPTSYLATTAATPQLLSADFLEDETSTPTELTVVRPISTTVSCAPGTVLAHASTTCTATVTDTSTGGALPTGTFSFTSSGQGSFSSSRCNLTGTGTTASCAVSYTASAVGSGAHTITAAYNGDSGHAIDTASASLTVAAPPSPPPPPPPPPPPVVRGTRTFIGCSPATVTPGHATNCTALVTGLPGTTVPPTGVVTFSARGGKLGASRCTLSGARTSATCSVSFTPAKTASDTPTVTASYSGDLAHTSSSGGTTLAPVAGITANLTVLQGTVLISVPSHTARAARASGPTSSSYVALKGTNTIPVGATIDARNGTLRLATAADYRGALDRRHRLQEGTFSDAFFTIEQLTAQQQRRRNHGRRATGTPPTNLRLVTPTEAVAAADCHPKGAAGKGIVRSLSGRANGLFRVIGAASTTIVRNATWTVEDRCDGTLTQVGRGRATVSFLLRRKPQTRLVKAGRALLVSQRFPVGPVPTVPKGIPLP